MSEQRIVVPPPFGALALACAALATASCGGGPRHVAEITPAVAASVSRIWLLDERESDDPADAAALPGRGGGDERGGMRPPPGGGMTGGRGGRPPGGGMPGGGPEGGRGGMRPGGRAPRGRGDARAAQEIMRMVTVPPRRLELSLSDSSVTVTYPREDPWIVPFRDGVKRKMSDDVEVEAKAEWKEGLLSVTRSVAGAGSVKETFYPAPDGARLTVVVRVAMAPRGEREFRRVYRPAGAGTGESRR